MSEHYFDYVDNNPANMVDPTGEIGACAPGVDCDELAEKIQEQVNLLKRKGDEICNDPLNLQNGHRELSNPLILPNGENKGSVEGHRMAYQNQKKKLRELMYKWDMYCNDGSDDDPFGARGISSFPAPYPRPKLGNQHNMSQVVESGGKAAGAGAVAYVVYRVLRMMLSIFAPPTAIPNALIP
jgi:hypothetical protein